MSECPDPGRDVGFKRRSDRPRRDPGHGTTRGVIDLSSDKTKRCIDARLNCYATCLGMASNRCLKVGRSLVEQERFRVMLACAEMCRTHAHLMILGSPYARHLAPECAEIATRLR